MAPSRFPDESEVNVMIPSSARPVPSGEGHLTDDEDRSGRDALCRLAGAALAYPSTVELFGQGDKASDVYLIDDGLAKLIHIGENGQEMIVGLRTSGTLLGSAAVITGEEYPVSAVTLIPSRLYRIPAAAFLQLMNINPVVSHYLLRQEGKEILAQLGQLSGFGLSAQQRLERLLEQLAQAVNNADGSRPIRLPLVLKQWELAQLVAVTPQHLSRLMKKMK